jgi:hypothetical protein
MTKRKAPRQASPDDKYDEAIAYLREQDAGAGSYLEEIACLMEELLGRVFEAEAALLPPPPPSERDLQQAAIGRALARHHARHSSAAKDDAE